MHFLTSIHVLASCEEVGQSMVSESMFPINVHNPQQELFRIREHAVNRLYSSWPMARREKLSAMVASLLGSLLLLLFVLPGSLAGVQKVCIVGAGIGGASTAFFLQNYSSQPLDVHIFERQDHVGGRLAQVQLGDDFFEAGGSIIADKNRHMRFFAELLGLTRNSDLEDGSFGIWDGRRIFFQTLQAGDSFLSRKLTGLWNACLLFWRYGTSLLKMQSHVSELLAKWDKLYDEDIPVYDTVESLLESVDLYKPTKSTLEEDLLARGLSPRLINELVTVIVRVNYGQSVSISGLAGAVALAGSGDDLWNVKEGNWKVPEGLIKYTNASLHLNQEVLSVTNVEGVYQVGFLSGQTIECDAMIIATPLDELNITFDPPISIPKRSLQHTYTTFVRGLINSEYFGAKSAADLPMMIGTVEDSNLQFSSISVLKSYTDVEKAYKVFSRAPLTDRGLDQLFRVRYQTIQIDWGAYPHYKAPEQFAPILLDGNHLYYINTFESAASAMEASAVAARHVARLLLSRLSESLLAQVVDHLDTEGASEL